MNRTANLRTRCGSWDTFERRFKPIDGPDGATYWSWEQLPKPLEVHRVWTIVQGGSGKLYVSPGLRFVNRIDYVYCEVPWTDDDERQPDYRYD
jgi:hypothetical protein